MQKFLRTLTLVALLFVPWVAQGQNAAKVSEYDVSVANATYTTIYNNGGTAVNMSTGTGTAQLQFAMPFGESPIASGSNVTVNANGSIQFGDGQIVAPLMLSSGAFSGGTVLVQSTTTSFVVECRKARTGSNSLSFQVALFPNGDIEFRYGPMTLNGNTSVIMGMKNGDDIYRVGTTPDNRWDTVVRATSGWTARTLSSAYYYSSTHPAYSTATGQGVVYTFTQPACVKPSGVTVANPTFWDSLFVSWEAYAGATKYEVYVTDATAEPTEATSGIIVTSTTAHVVMTAGEITGYHVGGLQGETTYRVYVRKYCGDIKSGWAKYNGTRTTLASCPAPTASHFALNAGVITWPTLAANRPNITSLDFYYSTSNTAPVATDDPSISNVAVATASVDLNTQEGIEGATTYYVWVRGHCTVDGGNITDWVSLGSFTTPCVAITVTNGNPYVEGFEDYEGTTYSNNGVVPNCWESYTTGSIYPHVIGSGSYWYKHNGTKALTFYGSGYCYATLPEFSNALSGLQISFWYQTESASNGTLTLGYITAEDNNMNTFTEIQSFPNHQNSMTEIDGLSLASVPATATRLVFRWYYSSQWSCCIDDVVVSIIPTCPQPKNLAVTPAGVATWLASANATSYDLAWNTTGVEPTAASESGIDGTTFTIPADQLGSNTTYYVWLRSHCSATSEVTDWVGPVEFTTPCMAIAVNAANPYSVDFKQSTMPDCWSQTTDGDYDWNFSTTNGANYYSSSYNYDYPSSNKLVSPLFNLGNGIYWLNFSGQLRTYNGTASLTVYYRTSADGGWTELDAAYQSVSGSYSATTSNVNVEGIALPEGTVQLAFESSLYRYSTTYAYLYDMSIVKAPSCIKPSNLTNVPGTGATGATTAELNWTENSPTAATQWEVRYAPAGIDIDTFGVSVVANAKPYTLTNLDMATTYNWKVRSLCSTEDVSDWSDVSSFTTGCISGGDISLGEHTTASNYLPAYRNYDYSFTEQIFTSEELGGGTTIEGLSYYVTTDGKLDMTVAIYLAETEKTSFSNNSDFVSTDGMTLVYSGNMPCGTSGWHQIDFTTDFEYSGNNNLIVVVDNNTGAWGNYPTFGVISTGTTKQSIYAYQDNTDITASNVSSVSSYNRNVLTVKNNFKFISPCDQGDCVPPTVAITVGPDDNNAKADLTFSGDETGFGYICVTQGTTPNIANGVTVTGNTATITPLVPETAYDLYVYSVCTGVENPRMVRYGFTTPFVPTCKPQVNFDTNDVTFTGATVVWQQEDPNQVPESWMLRWATEDFTPEDLGATYNSETITGAATGSFTFSGLHNGDHIYMYTKAVCGANDASVVWSGYDFQIPVIAAPTALASWHTTNISDSLRWTEATAGINSWTVAYATADFDPTDPTAVYETLAATNDSVKLSGLEPYTTYYVYVRANAGDEHSDWSAKHTFTTLCPEPTDEYIMTTGTSTLVSDRAMIYDNGGPDGNYTNSFDGTVVIIPATPGAMMKLSGTYGTEGSSTIWDYLTVYNGTSATPANRLSAERVGGGTDGEVPEFVSSDPTGALTLTFHSDNSTNNWGFELLASVAPCNTSVTCFAPVMRPSSIDSTNNVMLRWSANTSLEPVVNNYRVSYSDREFDPTLAGAAIATFEVNGKDSLAFDGSLFAGDKDYYFAVQTNCGTEGSKWVMTTIHTYPDVYTPTNLVASTPAGSSNKVSLTWTDKNPASFNVNKWDVVYGDTMTATPTEVTSTTYVVEGLNHSTTYAFYVRAKRGDKVSFWSEVAYGRTGCAAWNTEELPIVENFDTYDNNAIPACWDTLRGSGSYPNVYNHQLRFGGAYTGNYAILPELASTVDVSNLTLDFSAQGGSGYTVYVGVMTDPNDKSTFDTVATINTTSSMTEYTVSLEDYATHTKHAGHTGSRYVALTHYNYSIYVDDVTLKVTEQTNLLDADATLEICNEYIMPDTTGHNGNYAGNLNRTYVIRSAEAGKVVRLKGSVDLEQGYDFLSIYRGAATAANLIGTYTGSEDIDLMTESYQWADSGYYTLVLTTDGDNGLDYYGFKLMASCECPALAPAIEVPVETIGKYTWEAPQGNGKTFTNHYTRRARAGEETDLVPTDPKLVNYTQDNIGGCDSIAKSLQLVLHPDFLIKDTVEICQRDTFDFFGQHRTVQGDYVDTMKTIHNADSIGWLHLTVHEAPVAYIYYNNSNVTAPVTDYCDNAQMILEGRSNMASTFEWEDHTEGVNHTVFPHVLDTFTVVATDNAYGCTSLPTSIFVSTTTVADLSISATDSVICRGESTTLTLADANNVEATYRWSNNQTGTSITVTPDSTTTYTVTATTSNDSKCQTSATFTVVVNQLPEVQLTSLAEVCRDSALTLSATVVDGYTYLWSNNATTATTTVNPNVTATYSVTVTETATGCVNEFTTKPITVNPSYTVNDTMEVCYTQNPYTWGAQTLTEDGDYTQNFKIAHGCDSLVNVNFSFKDMATINTRRDLCEGAAYTWGGNAYTANLDTTLHYVSTPVDCPVDSVLMLTVNHPAASSSDKTVCDSYTWVIAGDTVGTYTTTDAYSTILKTVKGCDSTVTLNLTVNYQNAGTDVQNVCDELEWIDGKVYTKDTVGAQYTLSNQFACDSVVTLNLTLRHSVEGDTAHMECDSRSFTWWATGETYALGGDIRKTWAGQAANGCDTTAVLHLTMNYVTDTLPWVNVTERDVFYLTTVDCEGNEVEKEYRYSQDIQERIPNAAAGHDQWYRAHLTVNTSENRTVFDTACVPYELKLVYYRDTVTMKDTVANWYKYVPGANDSLMLAEPYKTMGYYPVATLTESDNVAFNTRDLGYDNGASDLILRIRFTAKNHAVKTTKDTICSNEPAQYASFGTLVVDEVNTLLLNTVDGAAANGCDSIYKVDLMVYHATNDATDTLTLCESEFDTNYEYVITNPNDTNQKVTLTIAGALNEMPSYGNEVSTTGWTTVMGCDSNVTYRYTVLPTVRETVKDTACKEYVWAQNGKTYEKSGEYIDTISSVRYGCDSIVTLQLTIYDTVQQHEYYTVCNTYEGPDGNTYRVDSTFEVVKSTSKWGCDTILYLHYTVQGMRTVYQNVITNADYDWNGTTYKASVSGAQYDATLPNGCDSVVILNLTRVPEISLCEGQLPDTVYGVVINTVGADQQYAHQVRVNDTIFDTVINYTVNGNVTTVATADTVKCDSFTYKDSTYTASTIIRDTMTSVVTGCDSILVFNLVINKSTDSVHTQVACDNYIWAGLNIDTTGTIVIDTTAAGKALKNAVGCDSTATLHLTINKNTPVKFNVQACGEYYWTVNNNNYAGNSDTLGHYTASDSVVMDVQDINGCWTSDTLVLTINAGPVLAKDSIVINAPTAYYKNVLFTAPFKSDTVTDAEMQKLFVDTLYAAENTGACDTILTHVLFVEVGDIVNEHFNACGRFTWARNNHTYEWIPVEERQQGNPIFNYKDITTGQYIQENPMYTTYTADSAIDKTYVLWLSMSEATIADSVYAQFPLSQETLTIGDSTFNFASYKALKKDTTVSREVHYGSTYYCDSIEYWTIHLKYNYDTTPGVTYVCFEDVNYKTLPAGTMTLVNDTLNKGTDNEMVMTDSIYRRAKIVETVATAITACDRYTWGNELFTSDSNGIAISRTLKSVKYPTCDSTVTFTLNITNTVHNVNNESICAHDTATFTWHGRKYQENTVDTFKYVNTSNNQCWNVDTLKLTLKNDFTYTTDSVKCDEFVWNGETFTEDSIIKRTLTSTVNGCDSVVTINLTIYNTSLLTHDTINHRGGSYRFNGRLYQAPTINDSVDITLKNINGCDSVVRYHIWVEQYEIEYDNVVACGLYTWPQNNHTYQWISDEERAAHGNALYKDITDDTYVMTYPFDTVDIALRYLNLTLNEVVYGDTTVVRFPLSQDSLILGNDTFYFADQKAAKKDTTVNVWFSAGHNYYCDSMVYATINLVYNYNTVEENVCYATDTLVWNGKKFPMPEASKTYTFVDTTDLGTPAEQVTTKKVYRRAEVASTVDTTVCDSIRWTFANAANNWDTLITDGGIYVHNFTDVNGCDSTVTMTVNMFHDLSTAYYDTVCDKKVWHDSTYTVNGTYFYSYLSADAGKCASVDTLYLVVNKNLGNDTTVVACDHYTWHGTEYTTSGKPTWESVDANGCTHMDTLWLTVNRHHEHDSIIYAGEGSFRYNGVMYTEDTNFRDTLTVKTVVGNCDSIIKVQIHVGMNYYVTDDTIVCSEYTWRDGNTYEWISTAEREAHNAIYKNRTTGAYVTYMPTYVKHNENDYDSIFTLNLTLTQRYTGVDDTVFFVSNKTLVYGDSIFDYTAQNTRAYNALGFSDSTFIKEVTFSQPVVRQYCDSVIQLNVTLKNNYVDSGDVHICVSDQSYTWRGQTINTSTSDYDHAHGPWRIYDTLTSGYIEYVTVYQHPFTYSTDRRVACDSYTWVNGQTYTESTSTATYTTEDQYGCDSVLSLVLTIKKNSNEFTDTTTHCGEYTWKTVDGHEFTFDHSVDTAYYYTATNGCPSVDSLHFVYNHIYTVAVAETACDQYVWEGYVDPATNKDTVILAGGTYKHTFQSAAGCDSTVTLTLTVNHNSNKAEYDTTYFGDTYTWHGREYTEGTATSVATDTFSYYTISGCMSVDTLYLTMKEGKKTIDNVCDRYTWHGNTYTMDSMPADTNAWTFYFMNKTAGGKDLSQDTLVLTLRQSTIYFDTVATCHSYTWNGITKTNNSDTVEMYDLGYHHPGELNEAGCDVIDTLHLVLGNSRTFVYQEEESCGPYVWTVNGQIIDTLTESMQTSANVHTATGCDSVVNLTLTVYEQPVVYESAVICDNYAMPYVWRGKSYTAAVEDDTVHAPFSAQCDSIYHFSLTINETKSTELTAQVCLGNGYHGYNFDIPADSLKESKEYTFVEKLQTINGCDSVVTLTLTVGTVLKGDTAAVACNSFDWYGQTYTTSGNYTYKTSTLTGCDSIVTLALTVNVNSSSETNVTRCDSYEWNGTVYTTSGTYTFDTTDVNGCDSVATLHLTISNSTTGDTTAVACNYFVWHGQAYVESGDYTYTLSNGENCDSVVTLHLTINQPVANTISATDCGSYTWNDVSYNASGVYQQTFTAANGCDSVVTLNLTLNQPVTSSFSATACESYTWGDAIYTTSGSYQQTYPAANGCDSIVTLNLTVNHGTHNVENAIACDNYIWHLMPHEATGTYTYEYTNVEGCASVDTLHLTINASTHNAETVSVCESYEWHGETYTTSGDKLYNYINATGCASVDTLHLTIKQPVTNAISESACNSYTWGNATYVASGSYQQTFAAANGCDSIVTLTLTINQPSTATVTYESCNDYVWNGQTCTASGVYTYTTVNAAGCDSVVTLFFTRLQSVATTVNETACGSYTWNGQTYTTSGTYNHSYTATSGCDSLVTLVLTVNQPINTTVTASNCDSYTWFDQAYTTSGTYTHAITDANGCAATATLNLTIYNSASTTVNETACNSYSWNGNVYTNSGNYSYQTTTTAGCDSTVTLNLTITAPVEVTIAESACSSYEWNGVTYTTSGTYTYTTTSAATGCDSVTTLVLTVNQPVYTNLVVTADGSYNWNGEEYTESGVYTYTTEAANGCDSIVTLELTVNPLYNVTLVSANETMGTVSESGTIVENGYFTAVATANEGYEFVAWMNGSEIVSTAAVYVFQVTEDITLTAVFQEKVGIEDVDMDNVTIYSSDSRIFVRGAEGYDVYVYDVNGRMMDRQLNAPEAIEFRMTATGVYLVKVGNAPAKRVVVVR